MDYFKLDMPRDELLSMSSLGLAHLGDGVFEVMVRSWLCLRGKARPRDLHRATVKYVAAPAQAAAVERLLPILTEEEPPQRAPERQPGGLPGRHRAGGPVRLALSPGADRPAQRALSAHYGARGSAGTRHWRPPCPLTLPLPQ